jgi:coenzyme F420-0:L-glutamate ligase / coenzyme F420-1:gamma-L-glutamate ligase
MVADTAEMWSAGWVEDLVRERRSIRHFRDEPIESEVVVELLRATAWAPSPHNSQPWRFTVLTQFADKARLAGDMAERLRDELTADRLERVLIDRQVSRSYDRVSTAPVVIVCSLEADGLVRYHDDRRNNLEWQMAVQSVGAALQTLFLLSASKGIGTCWMAAPMYCPDVVRGAIQLPPDFHPQALVLMGYQAAPGKARERRPFDQIVDLR